MMKYTTDSQTGSRCQDVGITSHDCAQILRIFTCISIHGMNLFIPFWEMKQLICISMHGAVLLLALVQGGSHVS